MRLTFEPTAFWAVSNIFTVFSASPPSKVVGVSLGIYLAVCRAFLRLAFPKLVSALDWHFLHRHHLTFLLPFGSTTTFGDCRFCFILIHFGHQNPTLRYYYQVLSMKCIGESPNTSDVLVTRAVYVHCCSYPLSAFLPNGSEDLPFISFISMKIIEIS